MFDHVPAAGFRVDSESAERTQFACVSGSFSVVAGEQPSENVHLAFAAADNETVDRFHREATAAGYRDNGAPGERPVYHAGYYAAFVLDPDGLWSAVLRRQGGPYALLSLMPPDPSLN